MAIHFSAPRPTELKPRIVVFGVGGAGGNAVNNMIDAGLEGVEFVVANTDAQQLAFAKTDLRIQLGATVTQGLGAGAHPENGMSAAEESAPEIGERLDGVHMVFITAGMGGGTGTGAAPVVADLARELGALTVAVVTRPFSFEGPKRQRLAEQGVTSLMGRTDTIITIPNDKLMGVVEQKTTLKEAFRVADDVLRQGIQGISDIITVPGQVNVDFADVRAVMANAGPALMGIGYGVGEQRALQAAQSATNSPLLEQTIHGARGLLVNITSGDDLTLAEVNEAMGYIHDLCDSEDSSIYFGHVVEADMEASVRITVLATGFNPYSSEGKKVASATFSLPLDLEVPVVAETAAVVTKVEKPRATLTANGSSDRSSRNNGDASNVFDESDLDIPAFIREHRSKQQ